MTSVDDVMTSLSAVMLSVEDHHINIFHVSKYFMAIFFAR